MGSSEERSGERVGFIGLGRMGAPMAANLLAAGYELTVFNRSPEKTEPLAAAGAFVVSGPAEVAARSDVVITMLPDSPDVERVLAGPEGVFEGARPGALIIDMSTISPVMTRLLAQHAAERGLAMLDAPVSGADVGAREGTLAIMVGGEADAVARAMPLFEVMGSKITHVGPSGSGQVVKACNQVITAVTIAAVSEAIVLGERAGVEAERMLDAVSGGLAGSKVIDVKRPQLLSRDFEPGFTVDLHHKDLGIVLATAREYGVSLPFTAVADQFLEALRARGMGDRDHTALLALIDSLAGRRPGSERVGEGD
jgi:2-hydroxy-3-oxopropionate reductase